MTGDSLGFWELVRHLDDLHETDRIAVRLIAEGRRAVPALVRFLLDGPRLHPQPRMAAAEVLVAIGGDEARDGLIAALGLLDRPIESPALQLSEEAVSNTAAACLVPFPAAEVVPALRTAFRKHRLVGAAEALARFGDSDCVSDFVQALEDDFKRERLLDVLESYGDVGSEAVAAVLSEPYPPPDAKLLVKKRAACLQFPFGAEGSALTSAPPAAENPRRAMEFALTVHPG